MESLGCGAVMCSMLRVPALQIRVQEFGDAYLEGRRT